MIGQRVNIKRLSVIFEQLKIGKFSNQSSRLPFYYIGLISLALILTACISTEDIPQQEASSESIDPRVQELEIWEWETNNRETIPFSGRLLFTVTPPTNSQFVPNRVSHVEPMLPQKVRIRLPRQEQILGTVSVALDPSAEASSLVLDAWLQSRSEEGDYETFNDINPFTSVQLLFTTSTKQSNLWGEYQQRNFELFASPNALPPFRFTSIQGSTFNLNLPPVSGIEELRLKVWQSLDQRVLLGRAKASLWHGQRLISQINTTDLNGEVVLSYWQESILEQNELNTQFELVITPTPESRLPQLRKTLTLSDLNRGEVELTYPDLGSLNEISLSIELSTINHMNTDDHSIWTAWVQQTWLNAPDQDYSHPSSFNDLYGIASWSMSYPIIPSDSNQISVFKQKGALFLSPPSHSSERSQKIELEALSEFDSLRLSSLPKPLIRGLLRNEDGNSIQASIQLLQLAWPWREAYHLPLHRFTAMSNQEGGFSIAVEPGIYAVSYLPTSKDYAPKVIILSVPEAEGLLLSPQQTLIERGDLIDFRTAGEDEDQNMIQVASRVVLECLIPRAHPLFLGSSEQGTKEGHLKASLYQGFLRNNEVLKLRIAKDSCPDLFMSEEESQE